MTLEEYKQLPFKTDGDGKDVKIEEAWYEITRKQRRKIERELRKGREEWGAVRGVKYYIIDWKNKTV